MPFHLTPSVCNLTYSEHSLVQPLELGVAHLWSSTEQSHGLSRAIL